MKQVFDAMSHSLLLQKPEHHGTRGNTLDDLFTSYLTEYKQNVSINGSCLSVKILKSAVTQGSNVGPTLLNIR